MIAPLPPNWTITDFNNWFNPIYAYATAQRADYVFDRTPLPLQVNVQEYLATGSTSSPLPTAWSMLEFTTWINQLIAEALAAYYSYILASTPIYLQANVKERINYGLPAQAPITMSFMGATMPAGTSDLRASTGWTTGSTGVLTSFANDVPRFRYNATTLVLEGLLNEPAETNVNRNNSGIGVTSASPGVAPTFSTVTSTSNGLTRTLTAATTEDGLPCWAVRYAGTALAAGTATIRPEPTSSIAALPGQLWQNAQWVKLGAGTLANVTLRTLINSRNSGGGSTGNVSTPIVPTGGALRTQRTNAQLVMPAATAWVDTDIRMDYGAGAVIDVTFLIGPYKLALSATPLSAILTTAAAVTRAADLVTCTPAGAVAGFWDVVVTRLSGATTVTGLDLTAGVTYVPPTDGSPLQSVRFNWAV